MRPYGTRPIPTPCPPSLVVQLDHLSSTHVAHHNELSVSDTRMPGSSTDLPRPAARDLAASAVMITSCGRGPAHLDPDENHGREVINGSPPVAGHS
jgi:hypothetical protein